MTAYIHVTPVLSYQVVSTGLSLNKNSSIPSDETTSKKFLRMGVFGKNTHSQFEKNASGTSLSIILDRSHSMYGNSITSACDALSSIVPKILPCFQRLRVFLFAGEAHVHDVTSFGPESLSSFFASIETRGGTSFRAIFDKFITSSKTINSLHETVIFLTDGEDNSIPRFNPISSLRAFKSYLDKLNPSFTVHCIGLGRQHDAKLMTSLTGAGNRNGTFIYARDAVEIEQALNDVLSVTSENGIEASLNLTYPTTSSNTSNRKQLPIFLAAEETAEEEKGKEVETEVVFSSNIVISDENKIESASITLQSGEDIPAKVIQCADPLQTLSNSDQATPKEVSSAENLLTFLVQDRISFYITQIPAISSNCDTLQFIENEISAISTAVSAMGSSSTVRTNKDVKRGLYELKILIKNFQNDVLVPIIRSRVVDNTLYAELANKAFAGQRRGSLDTLMGKRVRKKANLVNDIDKRVNDVVSKFNFDNDALFANTDEYGRCIFSFQDYKEAMEQGDCLCLGIEMQRPEAAVADASRVVVKKVSTSVITAESFLSAVMYRLNDEEVYDATEVHGGFTVDETGIVLHGTSREVINGALPLFINKEHWRVARLRGRPLLGWMTTLDVLGYSTDQWQTIPFLVLNAVRAGGVHSEYWRRVEKWVYETCAEILRGDKILHSNLFTESEDHPARLRYLHEVEARLSDVVASHDVFLAQISVSKQLQTVNLTPEDEQRLGMLIVSEEYGRRSKGEIFTLSRRQIVERMAALMGCERSIDIDPFVAQGIDILTKDMTTNRKKVDVDKLFKNFTLTKWDATRIANKVDQVSSCFDKLFNTLVLHFRKWLPHLPLLSNMQKLAIAIVHMHFTQSSDIRGHCEKYEGCLEQAMDNPTKEISKAFSYAVRKLIRKEMEAMVSDTANRMEHKIAQTFAMSKNETDLLNKVGGKLYIGRNVGLCVKAMCKRGGDAKTVGVLWKMRVLMEGRVGTTGVFADADDEKRRKHFNGLAWQPRRQIVRRLFERFVRSGDEGLYGIAVEKEVVREWEETFPWMCPVLDTWRSW